MSSSRYDNNQVAASVPFDNSNTDFEAVTVQEALEEIGASASPGFSFGRSNSVFASTWLTNEGVPSNRAGRYVPIANPTITQLFTSNENINTYTLTFYEHDGDSVNLTQIATLTVTNSRGASLDVDIPVTQGRQLAVRLTSGNARNVVAGIILKGKAS